MNDKSVKGNNNIIDAYDDTPKKLIRYYLSETPDTLNYNINYLELKNKVSHSKIV